MSRAFYYRHTKKEKPWLNATNSREFFTDHATDITRKSWTKNENNSICKYLVVRLCASPWKYHLWETWCKISLVSFLFFLIIYKKQVSISNLFHRQSNWNQVNWYWLFKTQVQGTNNPNDVKFKNSLGVGNK